MSKLIHFIWVNKFDFKNDNARIPLKYRKNIENWKKLNSDWKITIWTGKMIHELILNSGNEALIDLYLSYDLFISKVDLAKLIILSVFPGLYVDMDYYCQQSINSVIDLETEKEMILVKEPYENLKNYASLGSLHNLDKFIISNAFIYVSKKTELLSSLVNLYSLNKHKLPNVLQSTGPVIFNMMYSIDENNKKIKLLEPEGYSKKISGGYCYTTYDNTWTTNEFFNDFVFSNYYYYPCLKFNNYFRFRDDDIDERSSLSVNKIVESGTLAFNTDKNIFYAIPRIVDLIPSYDTEFKGTFINKSYFKRKHLIPKIIHQIWIGSREAPISLMDTWKEKNYDWEYKFWNEKSINSEFPGLLENQLITKCKSMSGKADIIRYYILDKYGGIYIDADTECIEMIPEDMRKHKCFFVYESEYERGSLVNNCVIGSIEKNEIFMEMIKEFEEYDDEIHERISSVSYYSPGYITNYLQRHPEKDVFIYPSYYFSPTTHDRRRENTYLITQSIGFHVGCLHPKVIVPTMEKLSNMDDIVYLLNNNKMDKGVMLTPSLSYLERFMNEWKGKLLKIICSKKDILYKIGKTLLKDNLYRIEWVDIDNFRETSKKIDFIIFYNVNNASVYEFIYEKLFENIREDGYIFTNQIILPEDIVKYKGEPLVALPVLLNYLNNKKLEPKLKMFGERPVMCCSYKK